MSLRDSCEKCLAPPSGSKRPLQEGGRSNSNQRDARKVGRSNDVLHVIEVTFPPDHFKCLGVVDKEQGTISSQRGILEGYVSPCGQAAYVAQISHGAQLMKDNFVSAKFGGYSTYGPYQPK